MKMILLASVLLGGCAMMSQDDVSVEGETVRVVRSQLAPGDRPSPGAMRVSVYDSPLRPTFQARRIGREAALLYAGRFCQGKVTLMDSVWSPMGSVSTHDVECDGRVL
jgi:hypothetical protein